MAEPAPYLSRIREPFIDSVKKAGALALSHLDSGDLKQWDKKPGDPVSDADLAVDAFMKESLSALLPEAGWLSEETEDSGDRLTRDLVWIVDPIDGTRSFLKGGPNWGVSAALVKSGHPVLAAFYAPAQEKLFVAAENQGTEVNGSPVQVSKISDLNDARMMGHDDGFRSKYWPVKWPDSMDCYAANSIALRLCLLADGTADACVTLRPKNDWDIVAAHLILKEAGGVMETSDRKPIIYNQANTLHANVVASNGHLQQALFDRVIPAIEAWRERQRKEKENNADQK